MFKIMFFLGVLFCGGCNPESSSEAPRDTSTVDTSDSDSDFETDTDADTDADSDSDSDSDTDTDTTNPCPDADGDGYTSASCGGTDCDDDSAAINPGATESDCTDSVDYNCDGSTGYSDADGDGTPACEDCNDADAAVFPNATEICDDIDNDCDGMVDGGDSADATTLYLDADGDGYGNATVSTIDCPTPEGYVANSDDCDDASVLYNPGAVEDCTDMEDFNCDGSISAEDADGDGYMACEECDDSDATVNPSVIEICDDIDNDCDGTVDGGDSADATTLYLDADGDGYGDPEAPTVDCAGTPGYASSSDDCDDGSRWVKPSETEVCDSIDNNCDGSVDEGVCDTGGDTGAGDTGGDTAVADTSGSESGGSDTSGGADTGAVDTGVDTGTVDTGSVPDPGEYSTDFGDGEVCSTNPFIRSDDGSAPVSYDDGSGNCGVCVLGGGTASEPLVSLDYPASAYTAGAYYVARFSVLVPSSVSASVLFYADFGGGTVETVTVSPGTIGSLALGWTADSSVSAMLRIWTSASSDCAGVVDGLEIVKY